METALEQVNLCRLVLGHYPPEYKGCQRRIIVFLNCIIHWAVVILSIDFEQSS